MTYENNRLHVPNDVVIPVIAGDGIGPEIWRGTKQVLDVLMDTVYEGRKRIKWLPVLAGELAFKKTGKALPKETIDAIKTHMVALKGPLKTPIGGGIRSLNVSLRKTFDLFACVRPIDWFEGLPTPVKYPEFVDMVIFRENTEDIYTGIEWDMSDETCTRLKQVLKTDFGVKHIPNEETASIGIKPVSKKGSQRLVEAAITYAKKNKRKRVTLVHKGNIMKFTEGRFRDWGYEIAVEAFGDDVFCMKRYESIKKDKGEKAADLALKCAEEAGAIIIDECITDAFFQNALINPKAFDVIATTNLNGDFISDALAAQIGGVGLAPGGNINYQTGYAIFEATHGTAPAIAGKGIANPSAMILSAYMCLNYIRFTKAASLLLEALKQAFREGHRTIDLVADSKDALSTQAFCDTLCEFIKTKHSQVSAL